MPNKEPKLETGSPDEPRLQPREKRLPKPKSTSLVEKARHHSWKFFGALFMEEKNGVQAVSLHRVLGFATYVACLWMWLGITSGEVEPAVTKALVAAKIDVPRALTAAAMVPDSMLYTLWALLGINGADKVMKVFKNGEDGNGKTKTSGPLAP